MVVRPNQLVTSSLGFPYAGDPSLGFRPSQATAITKNVGAIQAMVQRDAQYPGSYPVPALILHAPTGTGKTLAAVATAVEYIKTQPDAAEWQVVYVVSTKLHQDEVTRDFPNFADLRGRNNHKCFDSKASRNCAEAAHSCKYAGSMQCNASQQSVQARMEPYVVTNYSMWFAYGMMSGKWPVPKEMDPETRTLVPMYNKLFVIFDEAHDLVKELTGALTISLGRSQIQEAFYGDSSAVVKLFPWPTKMVERPKLLRDLKWDYRELEPWVDAAKLAEPLVATEFDYVKSRVDSGVALHGKLNKLDQLLTAVRMLSYSNPREWAMQVKQINPAPAVQIQCVRLENKIKPLLVQQANVVMLMSATISQCVLGMLGFKVKTVF